MECFFPLMLVLGFAIWGFIYLSNQLQLAQEEAAVYKDNIPESHVKLMVEAFGISSDELRFMHFDGISFDLHGKPTFKDFSSVNLASACDVNVVNSKLPHTGYWQHARVDGGPDRRFSNNRYIMTSRRYQLSFCGLKKYTLTTYRRPSYHDNVQTILDKFNTFLMTSQSINLELAMGDYEALNSKIESLKSALQGLIEERSQLERAIAAASRLYRLEMRGINNSVSTESLALQKEQLDLTIAVRQKEIDHELINREAVIKELKEIVEQQKDLQLVQSYSMSNK